MTRIGSVRSARRTGNPGLRRYYEELGFEHRGDPDVPGLNWRASLYEKPLR